MSVTAQDLLKEIEEKNRLPSAQQLLADIEGTQPQVQPAQIGGLDVNTSPIQLPPDTTTTFGAAPSAFQGPTGGPPASLGQATPQTTATIQGASLTDRALAARGVDTTTGLQDFELRKALGFSPNQAFTADFLNRKLQAKSGIEEDMVRFNKSGSVEFFQTQNNRWTVLDGSNLSRGDLADLYGPGRPIGAALTGSIAGLLAAGPPGSIVLGATAAFTGELARLLKGRELGVHDLTDAEITEEALQLGAIDAAFGLGGEGILALKRLGKSLLRPTGVGPDEANTVLVNMEKNADVVDDINTVLRRAGSDERFRLTTVEQAEDISGQTLLQTEARSTRMSAGVRAAELKDTESALQAAIRATLKQPTEGPVARSSQAAGPAQAALRQEKHRLEAIADRSLLAAEQESHQVVNKIGKVDREAGGKNINRIVNTHGEVLTGVKNDAWGAYQVSIGQQIKGTPGWTAANALTSNLKVPITPAVTQARKAATAARKQSMLSGKAAGRRAIRPVGNRRTVDLAVLDDDIKEIRDLLRRGDPGFSSNKLRRDLKVLVDLRNDFLANTNPGALRLLERAEQASAAQKTFLNESIFARILKQDFEGKFILDDVATFKAVWGDRSGAAMRELIVIAKKHPGGFVALQEVGEKIYRTAATPRGSNILSKDLHDKFIAQNEDILKQLYPDPRFLRFGKLAESVARNSRRVDRVRSALAKSPLARLGGVHPENMAKAALSETTSVAHVQSTMRVVTAAGKDSVASFQDAMGRHIFNGIAPDGKLSTSALAKLLNNNGEKLTLIYGDRFVKDLGLMLKGLRLARQKVSGVELKKQTLWGMLARGVGISPPLSTRGRLQTFGEFARQDSALRAIHRALRDPDILRSIVANGERDIRHKNVMAVLSQVGGVALIVDDRILEE